MPIPTDAELDRRAAAINAAAIAEQQAAFHQEYPDLAAKLNGSAPTDTRAPIATMEDQESWELGAPGNERRRRDQPKRRR